MKLRARVPGALSRGTIGKRRWLAALALLASAAACQKAPEAARRQAPFQFEVKSANPLDRGERLATILGCGGCHAPGLTGQVWDDDPQFAILYTSNLTRALPAYSDAALERAVRFGVRPDGSVLWAMPSQRFTRLSAPDMAALIAYLRSRPPAGEAHPRVRIGPGARRLIASGELKSAAQLAQAERNVWPPRLDGRHGWALYMIRATCAECHGPELKGEPVHEEGETAPDLAVAGGYTRAQFHHLLRTGEPTGGRRLRLMADVARERFVHLTDREVDAIYDYLKARAERPH